jgi:hypothetical protein
LTRPFPSVSDVRLAWNAGPAGASLAALWMDAVIASIPHGTTFSGPTLKSPARAVAPALTARAALLPTDPERYGWRFCALRPDGVLVAPFTSTEIDCGTFDAECRICGRPPAPDCGCGIHYLLRARDVIHYAEGSIRLSIKHAALQRIRDHEWAPALTYGVAVGAVDVDRTQYENVDAPSRRAARWHILAPLSPGAGPASRAALRSRYCCQVIPDASLGACEAVATRLESSVSPAQMAKLAAAT